MMDQRQTEKEKDSEIILKPNQKTNRPLSMPIHHPSSLPQHANTLLRHRHLKKEVLMSPIEMLTFR